MTWPGDLRARIIYSRSPLAAGVADLSLIVGKIEACRRRCGLSEFLVRVTLGRSRAATRSIGAHGQGLRTRKIY